MSVILEIWWRGGGYESSLHACQDEAAAQLTWARDDDRFKKGSVTIVTEPADLEPFAQRAKRHIKPQKMTPADFDLTTKLPQHPTLDTTSQAATRLSAMRNTGQTDFTEYTDAADFWKSRPLPEVYAGYAKPRAKT